MLRILASIAPSIAASMSASSNTRNGALPPSSIDVRSTCSEACSSSFRPTPVEPVKESLRARPSRISGSITPPASLVTTTLTTPSGSPASARISASASIDSGVCEAGLITDVQPAAMAGPSLRPPLALRFGDRLAHLEGHQQRQVVGPVDQDLVRPVQDLAALPGCVRRPRRLRRDRGVERLHPVGRGRVGDLAQHLTGGRVVHRQRPAARRGPPLPAYEQILGYGIHYSRLARCQS